MFFRPEQHKSRNPAKLYNVQKLSRMLRSCRLHLFFLYISLFRQWVSEKSLFNETLGSGRVTGTKKHRAEIWERVKKGSEGEKSGGELRETIWAGWTSFPSCSHLQVPLIQLFISLIASALPSLQPGGFFFWVPGHYYHYFIFYSQCATIQQSVAVHHWTVELMRGASR